MPRNVRHQSPSDAVQCVRRTDSSTASLRTLKSSHVHNLYSQGILRLKRDGTRAETRFRLSPKRTSPFKSAGASVQSTAASRGVRISISNVGYTTFLGNVRVLATHSIRQFSLHFPSRASPCDIRFQTHSTTTSVGFWHRHVLFHSSTPLKLPPPPPKQYLFTFAVCHHRNP